MKTQQMMLFDYTWARTYVGIAAFLISVGCVLLHNISLEQSHVFDIPPSISDTYHTGARDFFVAQLFVVAAFMISYRGHNKQEWWAAKFAAVFAMLIAWFPTNCKTLFLKCEPSTFLPLAGNAETAAAIHYIAAVSFFVLLIYFCFRFYKSAKEKLKVSPQEISLSRRVRIYQIGGVGMTLTIVVGGAWLKFTANPPQDLLFWIEAICLFLFGMVWLIAGKKVPYFK